MGEAGHGREGMPSPLLIRLFAGLFPDRRSVLQTQNSGETSRYLQEAIAQALLTITAQDAQGWFQHCGYLSSDERNS